MKIKLISIILTLILCLSAVSALVSCNDPENEEKPSGTESEGETREEETLPPLLRLQTATTSLTSFQAMKNHIPYSDSSTIAVLKKS